MLWTPPTRQPTRQSYTSDSFASFATRAYLRPLCTLFFAQRTARRSTTSAHHKVDKTAPPAAPSTRRWAPPPPNRASNDGAACAPGLDTSLVQTPAFCSRALLASVMVRLICGAARLGDRHLASPPQGIVSLSLRSPRAPRLCDGHLQLIGGQRRPAACVMLVGRKGRK